MIDIEIRLMALANKWRYANQEVYDVCRDAVEQIRLLRVTNPKKTMPYDPGTSGWGKGKDE
jgi:hypothetical protein